MANESDRKFVYVIYIATTPDKLWEGLTSGEFTKQYFLGRRVESDWRVGSPVTYWIGDQEKDVSGEVLVCEPPTRLSFTWRTDPAKDPAAGRRGSPSRLTFEIRPMGPVCQLIATHENLMPEDFEADSSKWKGVNNGWPAILSNLKSVLETGKPCLVFGAPPRPEK